LDCWSLRSSFPCVTL